MLGLAYNPAGGFRCRWYRSWKSRNTRAGCRGGTETLRLGKLIDQCCLQAAIARQAEHVVDAVCLAPSHQFVVAEAAVGAQDDARARPFLADPRDNARNLSNRTITARDVRTPLAGQQQVPTAEHVERQVAVHLYSSRGRTGLPARRAAECRCCRDPARSRAVRVHALRGKDPKATHGTCASSTIDLVILRRLSPRRVLQAIERALARQWLAVGPQHRVQLARQHRKRRVLARLIVIVEVFIAQRQAEDALSARVST